MAVRYYRAYVIGHDGRIQNFFEFNCSDDEEAKQNAEQYVDGHDVELWHRAEKIAEFKSKR